MPKPKTRISRRKPERTAAAPKAKDTAARPPARPPESKAKIQKARKKSGKKPNFFVRWWNETRGELRKVVWPTWAEVRYLTVVVLLVTFLTSAFFGFTDWLFLRVVGLLIGV